MINILPKFSFFLNGAQYYNIVLQHQRFVRFTFPVTVDPVNEIVDTRGLLQRTFPTSAALSREHVTTLSTPGGNPASSASC